jgi:hypothetical protein
MHPRHVLSPCSACCCARSQGPLEHLACNPSQRRRLLAPLRGEVLVPAEAGVACGFYYDFLRPTCSYMGPMVALECSRE